MELIFKSNLSDETMLETKELMEKAVNFHGHSCPGVTIGVLVAKYILEHDNEFSTDEELVAVVETDNCSVDALQALLGTTFGKGNLIHLDFGKNNFRIYNRTKKNAVRLAFNPANFGDRELPREDRIKKLLESNPEDIFKIESIDFDPPEKASIHDSIICQKCGEPTMSTRIFKKDGKNLCIPCIKKLNGEKEF